MINIITKSSAKKLIKLNINWLINGAKWADKKMDKKGG